MQKYKDKLAALPTFRPYFIYVVTLVQVCRLHMAVVACAKPCQIATMVVFYLEFGGVAKIAFQPVQQTRPVFNVCNGDSEALLSLHGQIPSGVTLANVSLTRAEPLNFYIG